MQLCSSFKYQFIVFPNYGIIPLPDEVLPGHGKQALKYGRSGNRTHGSEHDNGFQSNCSHNTQEFAKCQLHFENELRSVREHSNSRFESIRFYSLCESIGIDSFCKKNRPFDSLVVMQFSCLFIV